MFKNYLTTALRNLRRHKGFSFINIAGLSIGIIGCILIGLFVFDELKYDQSIPGGENVYRIYSERNDNNTLSKAAVTAPAIATYLKQNYPEVDTTLRILMSTDKFLIEAGDKKAYEEKGLFTEASIFSMFSLKLTKGDVRTALTEPGSVVISEDMATRYFGKEDPVGKTIKIDKEDFAVRGVLGKLPDHFHLNFNYLISLSSAGIPKERMEKWTWSQFYTYVKLKPGTNFEHLQDKFQAYVKTQIEPVEMKDGSTSVPFFQPLKNIHLWSADFVYDNAIRGNQTYVKGLSAIALFVLLIACFNFINLATARSFRRAKEIGVRKVIGALCKQLITQFIVESLILAFLAVAIAVIATFLILPSLNQFTGKLIEFNPFTDPLIALSLLAGTILIGILAGIYPAIVLSKFQPVKVLKGLKLTAGDGNNGFLRQALVVVQFALSALLIISSTIVYRQIKYLNDKDLGFNKEQLLFFQVRGDVEKNIEAFKTALKSSPDIVSVTSGYGLPGDQYAGDGVTIPANGEDKNYPANVFIGDYDYVKTLGLSIIAGRDFSRERATDVEEAFIINETAVKDLGFGTPEKALGQSLYWNKWEKDSLNPVKKGKVIGVVKDFHYKNLHEKVTASVIQIYSPVLLKVAVKIKTADVKNTIAFINTQWRKFAPAYPLDYKFMDETYGAMYQSEEKLGTLLWIFTIMAIVVGCMGLFGLATFSAEQRRKEIGIRKVLGANVFNIAALLTTAFLKPVVIASLIAFPIAWWSMNSWLQSFPYRVTISWWIFALAAIAALTIAFITVTYQCIKAARANPVKSLKTE